jgi:type I restriction enzyme S subunit
MSAKWPMVKLGEVLTRSEETIALRTDAEYRELTVKLWGKGVVLRGVVTGAEVAASRRFIAKAGQFVLSRIDARNGALGLVPEELDGAIVTNDFPVFMLDEMKLVPAFLGWMSRTADFVEMCQRGSEGTTNRVRLQADRFLALEIPLPPLSEQRRIVARIEALAAQIEEARRLRQQASEEAEVLVGARATEMFETSENRLPIVLLC